MSMGPWDGPKSDSLDPATQSDLAASGGLAVYRSILQADGTATGIVSLSTTKVVLAANSAPSSGGALNTVPQGIYFDPADYAISGKTLKLRLLAAFMTNATSPAITVTAGLYPITTPVGGSGVLGFSIGTVVSGSTAARALTANNAPNGLDSGDFDAPSAGYFALGAVANGSQAANSVIAMNFQLQIRHV